MVFIKKHNIIKKRAAYDRLPVSLSKKSPERVAFLYQKWYNKIG